MTDNIALEVKNITKHFPGVLANDQVSLNLKKGEIHALLGENGAGKTTLMNMVYGLYHPDSGQILVDGKAGALLLQIFSENQLGPIFFEFIQRKGDEGFGEGNFKALFESIELDQMRRGVLKAKE